MGALSGTRAFVTGASSGLGEAIARLFVKEGAAVVAAARRVERLERMEKEFGRDRLLSLPLDVRDPLGIERALRERSECFEGIDILVNNAGLARGLEPLHEGKVEEWEEMIETNVTGLLRITRAILPDMVRRKRGHIVNMGSTAGHGVYPGGVVYSATKHAVRAISEGLRLDLQGTGIRVTEIAPGMVKSEFSLVRFRGDRERAEATYRGMTPLSPQDVAEAVLWVVTRPPHVNVHSLVLFPTDQASVRDVVRRG